MEVMVDPMEATKGMVDMEVTKVMEAIDLMEVTKDMEVIMDKVEPELQIKQSTVSRESSHSKDTKSYKLEIF